MQNGEFQWEKPLGFDQEWLVSQNIVQMCDRSEWGRKAGPFSELFDPETNTTYYFNERSGMYKFISLVCHNFARTQFEAFI